MVRPQSPQDSVPPQSSRGPRHGAVGQFQRKPGSSHCEVTIGLGRSHPCETQMNGASVSNSSGPRVPRSGGMHINVNEGL